MTFIPHARRLGIALILVAGATSRAQSPLDVVPADAKVVVLVNNPERTMQGSEKFAQAIGQVPPPQDIGQMTQLMGELGSQWRVNRGMGIAIMQPGQDGWALITPVDDPAASLKAIKAEMKGDVGSFPLFGQDVMGAPKGKNLVVSTNESLIKAFPGDKTLTASMTPAQKNLADTSSVFVYLNVQSIKSMANQGGDQGAQLRQALERLAEQVPAIKQFGADKLADAIQRVGKGLAEQAKSIYSESRSTRRPPSCGSASSFFPRARRAASWGSTSPPATTSSGRSRPRTSSRPSVLTPPPCRVSTTARKARR